MAAGGGHDTGRGGVLVPHARSELLMEYLPFSAKSSVGRLASWPTVDHSGLSGKLSRLNPS